MKTKKKQNLYVFGFNNFLWKVFLIKIYQEPEVNSHVGY